MWIVILEACVAFFLLVFIVWWTMYQGKGQSKSQATAQGKADQPALPAKDSKENETE